MKIEGDSSVIIKKYKISCACGDTEDIVLILTGSYMDSKS